MRGGLRNLGVALGQSVVILLAFSTLLILGHLAFYQRLPRWK